MGSRVRRGRIRRSPPVVKRDKDNNVEGVYCPFCSEEHLVRVGEPAQCGTYLEITAVQPTFQGKQMVCARCQEPGGTLVKLGENIYVHANPCKPQNMYFDVPKTSLSARLAWKLLSDDMMVRVAKRFGRFPEQLVKLDKNGAPTDEIVGYHWKKVK